MKFKNISPQGDLDVPLVRRVVALGEVIDVTVEQARLIEGQTDVWERVAEEGAKK